MPLATIAMIVRSILESPRGGSLNDPDEAADPHASVVAFHCPAFKHDLHDSRTEQYQYAALDPHKEEICLIQILPSSTREHIELSVKHFSLTEAEGTYDAVSYT